MAKDRQHSYESITIPEQLQVISSPPKQLYYFGAQLGELLKHIRLAVVGSRAMSPYGQQVTQQLVHSVASQGILIISGLAYGIDATAHRAAIRAGGTTIAILPGPIDEAHPAGHRTLIDEIIQSGGGVLSEYGPGAAMHKTNFVARNRLVAGLAQAVLITEAGEKSGSLHTARFTLDQGKDVLVVPGAITDPRAAGSNNLIRSGAHVITNADDVLHALGVTPHQTPIKHLRSNNPQEQIVLDLLVQGVTAGDELQVLSGMQVDAFNQVLTMLELQGKIYCLGTNKWSIR